MLLTRDLLHYRPMIVNGTTESNLSCVMRKSVVYSCDKTRPNKVADQFVIHAS